MNKKGFTILETMISVTIFSVLMIIVFSCWTEFQKVALKNEAKQDTNVQFVNVYRSVDKIVSSASTRLFKCYGEAIPGQGNQRWFAFLVSRENNDLNANIYYASPDNTYLPIRMIYNTCVVYLLYYEQGCCGSFNNCPHKSLYRYVYKTTNEIYFGDIKTCNWGQVFKTELESNVQSVLTAPVSNSIAKPSVIQNNIVDLTINKIDDKFQFNLSILRINDAERHFQIGTRNLITPDSETRKYMEYLSWISIPSNT